MKLIQNFYWILKFDKLIFTDHLQNWLDFGNGLLIFLILVPLKLSEIDNIFLGTHGRNGLKFGMLMYTDCLQNWKDFGHGLLISLNLAPLSLVKFGVSRHFLENMWEVMSQG